MRTRLALGSLAGAVAIHVAFLACSGPRRDPDDAGDSGGVLEDVADAVRAIADGETRDARAQAMPMMVACDQVFTQTVTGDPTSTESTTWYAEISVPGIMPSAAPRVSAVLCDVERFAPPVTCVSPTCTETGYRPPADACTQALPMIAPGRVVVACGYRVVTTSGTTRTVLGERRRRAYVRID